MEVFGFDVVRSPMAARRLMGYVPQALSIEAALTGLENVMWFARLYDIPRRERKERVGDALEVMGLGTPPAAWRGRTPAAWCAASSWPRLWLTGPSC